MVLVTKAMSPQLRIDGSWALGKKCADRWCRTRRGRSSEHGYNASRMRGSRERPVAGSFDREGATWNRLRETRAG